MDPIGGNLIPIRTEGETAAASFLKELENATIRANNRESGLPGVRLAREIVERVYTESGNLSGRANSTLDVDNRKAQTQRIENMALETRDAESSKPSLPHGSIGTKAKHRDVGGGCNAFTTFRSSRKIPHFELMRVPIIDPTLDCNDDPCLPFYNPTKYIYMGKQRKGAPDPIPGASGYLDHVAKAAELEFILSKGTPFPDDLVR